MSAFPGKLEEYQEFEPGRWVRVVDGEMMSHEGVTTVSDGVTFAEIYARRAEEPKRTILKSLIVSRLIEAGKIGAAYQALNSNPAYWARWVASDRPAINCDDPDALALLAAIEADPETILAP